VVAVAGWPRDAAGLRELPGGGPYTAAAVAAFAFGEPVAAVDVNVARVAARLGRGTPSELVPVERAADWNQATMELGALVCGARVARCGSCPVASWCASAGRVPAAPRGVAREGARERFEDSNRWVRGRVVAALAAGEELPSGVAADRLERAVEGLVRDGLIRRDGVNLSLG
jgi:A/G-specific adenine glycosylase